MENFKDNHPLHGAFFGIATYGVSNKILNIEHRKSFILGSLIGSGLYVYMKKYGHSFKPFNQFLR